MVIDGIAYKVVPMMRNSDKACRGCAAETNDKLCETLPCFSFHPKRIIFVREEKSDALYQEWWELPTSR